MPKLLGLTKLNEKCPECDSQLVRITEQWNPFLDEECPSDIQFKSCAKCDYELVIEDELFAPKKVPYVRHRDGKYFVIRCVEQVYDEFDEFEHEKECEPTIVRAKVIEEAMRKGEKITQYKINNYRQEEGNMSKGMFIAKVTEVLDVYGNVLYNANKELANSIN